MDNSKQPLEKQDQIKKAGHRKRLGYLFVMIAGLLWGTSGFFVVKMQNIGVPTDLISFSGLFFGIFPLLLFVLFNEERQGLKLNRQSFWPTFLLGVVGSGLFRLIYDSVVPLVGVATASLLLYTSPVFSTIFGRIFLNEKVTIHKVFALVLNILGCSLMVGGGQSGQSAFMWLGIGLGLLAALIDGVTPIIATFATNHVSSATSSLYNMIFGALFLFFLARPWEHVDILLQGHYWGYALAYGLSAGALANLFFYEGIARGVEASRANILASVEVVMGATIGYFVFNEPIELSGLLGIIILLVSIVLINPPKRSSDKQIDFKVTDYE